MVSLSFLLKNKIWNDILKDSEKRGGFCRYILYGIVAMIFLAFLHNFDIGI